MTLSFSTHWPKSMGPQNAGKPNNFVPKIWTGLMKYGVQMNAVQWAEKGKSLPREQSDLIFKVHPKLHTFRQDFHNRWKVGMKIHPVINNRTKNRFQFAPELEVKGIQKVEITEMLMTQTAFCTVANGKIFKVDIDGRTLHNKEVEQLSANDGFESVEQFFSWFNKDFTGKIIHWTNLKY